MMLHLKQQMSLLLGRTGIYIILIFPLLFCMRLLAQGTNTSTRRHQHHNPYFCVLYVPDTLRFVAAFS